MKIRKMKNQDYPDYIALLQLTEKEGNMVHKFQEVELNECLKDQRKGIFLAEEGDQLIGYLFINPIQNDYQDHVAKVTIGVLKDYQRQGVGSQLLNYGKQWAAQKNIQRLELTVPSHNIPAISFYLKHDFTFEGIRKKSLRMDGRWYNELYLGYFLKS